MFKAMLGTLVAFSLLVSANTYAAFYNPNFSGNTEYEGWSNLTRDNNPGFPDSTASANQPWPSSILASEAGSAGNAAFGKVSGSGYPAGESIYNSFGSGSYNITNNNPLAGLTDVLFQIESSGFLGSPFSSLPVLNYNGGSQALVATQTNTGSGGSANTYAFYWDLSSASGITSFDIDWSTTAFSANYAMQLDTASPVPLPASIWLFVVALAGLGTVRAKSQK